MNPFQDIANKFEQEDKIKTDKAVRAQFAKKNAELLEQLLLERVDSQIQGQLENLKEIGINYDKQVGSLLLTGTRNVYVRIESDVDGQRFEGETISLPLVVRSVIYSHSGPSSILLASDTVKITVDENFETKLQDSVSSTINPGTFDDFLKKVVEKMFVVGHRPESK